MTSILIDGSHIPDPGGIQGNRSLKNSEPASYSEVCPCDCYEDSPSDRLPDDIRRFPPGVIIPTGTGGLSTVVGFVANLVYDIFKPFIDLLNSNSKITAKEFTTVLKDIFSELSRHPQVVKHLSKESTGALETFSNKVEELSRRQDFEELDLTTLIDRWQGQRDTKALFRMMEILRNPGLRQCSGFTDSELTNNFTGALERLTRALDELNRTTQSPETDRARRQVNEAIDEVTGGLRRRIQTGSDENMTPEDREAIRGHFDRSRQHIQNIIEDESLSQVLPDSLLKLFNEYIELVTSFLRTWQSERKEKKEAEEKKILREEGISKKKQIEKLALRNKVRKAEIEEFCRMMDEAKTQVKRYLDEVIEEENKTSIETKKHIYAGQMLDRHKIIHNYVKNRHSFEENRQKFEQNKKQDIVNSLQPSVVSDIHVFELDILC